MNLLGYFNLILSTIVDKIVTVINEPPRPSSRNSYYHFRVFNG